MPELYSIGTSALRTVQTALSTTGNNIANVNTEGYSRQSVNMATLPSQGRSPRQIGSGVTVDSIHRAHNAFVAGEITGYRSSTARYETLNTLAARIDGLLADSDASLPSAVQEFFAAVQDVTNSPTTLPERQVLIGKAEGLEVTQQSLYRAVSRLNDEVNSRMRTGITEVNALAASIAEINKSIMSARSSAGAAPELLDKRDQLVQDLSSKIGIRVNEQENGSLNIFVGNGHGLVVGGQVRDLKTVPNEFDASRMDVGVVGAPDSTIINDYIGGELKGLLDFRQQVFDPAVEKLGLMSIGLTETFNNQHQLGVDLDGQPGQAFFTPPQINAQGSTFNSSSDSPTVTITDAASLRGDSYSLLYNGTDWRLERASDGTAVTGSGVLSIDGLDIDTGAVSAPSAGDSYMIRPAHSAASSFGVAMTNPRGIAAAAPLLAETSLGNAGDVSASAVSVSDANNLPLGAALTLTYNDSIPGFDVSYAGAQPVPATVAYDPATDAGGVTVNLGLPGVSLEISGVPQPGDVLTLNDNSAGSGDNRNALALADLQSAKLLEGGSSNYMGVYSTLVSGVATQTNNSGSTLAVENALLGQAQDYQAEISGVNLDEEAANLLRFQQQYQAAAQLIAAADMVFNTLLQTTARR